MNNKKKIFICCTEQSGENICFNILKLIEDKKYIIDGVCGHNSSKYIRNKFYDISLFKSIGFFEILFSLLTFIKILNNLCNIILKNNYDLIICIDSPDFNYNLAKKIRKKGFKNKIIQIVAPTVWAWRSGRSKKFSKIYDEIFTLFEFEKKFFEKHGLKSTFIGHPIFNINKINTKSEDKKYISFLPGSRENELNKLLPFYEHLYEYLYKNNLTNWEIFIPTLPHLKEKIVNLTNHWKINTHVMTENDKIESYYQKVYISVTCSGTATLEISKRLIPQIIIYKLNFFTVFLFSFLVKVKYANLINIVNNKMIIPEIVNFDLTKKNLIESFEELLFNETNQKKQISEIKDCIKIFENTNSPYEICIDRIKKII